MFSSEISQHLKQECSDHSPNSLTQLTRGTGPSGPTRTFSVHSIFARLLRRLWEMRLVWWWCNRHKHEWDCLNAESEKIDWNYSCILVSIFVIFPCIWWFVQPQRIVMSDRWLVCVYGCALLSWNDYRARSSRETTFIPRAKDTCTIHYSYTSPSRELSAPAHEVFKFSVFEVAVDPLKVVNYCTKYVQSV